MSLLTLQNLPLLSHALLTLPAFLNFLHLSFNPHLLPPSQLPAILRNYSFLLLSTFLSTLTYASPAPSKRKDSLLSLSLAVYHLAPIARAAQRIWTQGEKAFQGERRMGGPGVHLIVHGFVGGGLIGKGLGWI